MPVGNALTVRKNNEDVELMWTAPPGGGLEKATNYAVFSSISVNDFYLFHTAGFAENPLLWTTTSATSFVHAGALDPLTPGYSGFQLYQAVSQNGCGDSRDAPLRQVVRDRLTDTPTGVPQDAWEVWIRAGTQIEITVDRSDDGGGISTLDPEVSLLDPSAVVVAAGDDEIPCSVPGSCPSACPQVNYTAAVDGEHRILVIDGCVQSPGIAGTYTLSMSVSDRGGVLHQAENDE